MREIKDAIRTYDRFNASYLKMIEEWRIAHKPDLIDRLRNLIEEYSLSGIGIDDSGVSILIPDELDAVRFILPGQMIDLGNKKMEQFGPVLIFSFTQKGIVNVIATAPFFKSENENYDIVNELLGQLTLEQMNYSSVQEMFLLFMTRVNKWLSE